MPSLANLVRVVSATAGTGTITLGGAVTGFLTPSQAGMVNGQSYSYAIEASYVVVGDDQVPTAREVGNGVYDSGAGTLTRNVINSTNGNSLLTLTGDQQVIICVTTESFSPIIAQNLVINGGMMVSQEKLAAATAPHVSSSYIVDMVLGYEVGAQVLTSQQRTEHPTGFRNSVRLTVTTANASPGATDYTEFSIPVEGYRCAPLGWGAAGAVSVAIGFWVFANRTGTYSASINNFAFNRTYAWTFTVVAANTWEYKTVVVPGDTSGTWEVTNSIGFFFNIVMMAGTSQSITANTWTAVGATGVTGAVNGVAATSDLMAITGVSIISGTVPVPRELSASFARPFDEDLALCQRYYEKSFGYETAPASNTGFSDGVAVFGAELSGAVANDSMSSFNFIARKRTNPVMTLFNPNAANSQIRDRDASADCTASAATAYQTGFWLDYVGNAATIFASRMAVHWVADARF